MASRARCGVRTFKQSALNHAELTERIIINSNGSVHERDCRSSSDVEWEQHCTNVQATDARDRADEDGRCTA